MNGDLSGSLMGMNVDAGQDALGDLPAEILDAVRSLFAVQPGATPADVALAQEAAQTAFGPLMTQVQNQPAPTPAPVPELPSDANQFLALLAANLAGSVNPAFAEPTKSELEAQRKARRDIEAENREQQRDFDKTKMERGFAVASSMATEQLKMAVDAGNTKAATEAALHLARINDALERRRNKEKADQESQLQKLKNQGKADGVEIDPDQIETYAKDLNEGTTEEGLIPSKLRPYVKTLMRQRGWRVTPKKVRQAIDEAENAQNVVEEIRTISRQVNTAREGAINRGFTGVKNLLEVLNQSGLAADLETVRGSFAGNLARVIGAERGVLTDQDRAWAMRMVPSIWTTREKAERDLDRLERALKKKVAAARKAWMTPGGEGRQAQLKSLEEYANEADEETSPDTSGNAVAPSDSTDYLNAPALDEEPPKQKDSLGIR